MTDAISHDQVRALADAADLPLGDDRLAPMAELLSAWLPAANELSRKMSQPEHDRLMPITVFTQPHTDGQE
ncbi:hypothetical protein [Nocardioides sp. LHG3406-4]|uniref:hypothetical protein n=1 Tax=Nocardioides sp. LHG3406-4 TaxID=2804575 RepID=UPI003CF6EFCA